MLTDFIKHRRRRCRIFSLLFPLLVSSVLVLSCGKRRPPVPPAAQQKAAFDLLTAHQQGDQIVLEIATPLSTDRIKQISIYRLTEAAGGQRQISADEFSTRATVIAVISQPAAGRLTHRDALSAAAGAARLRYAIKLFYQDGGASGLSNFVLLEPNFQIPLPPVLTEAKIEPEAIRLRWQAPTANLNETSPANAVGYNLYRLDRAEPEKPLRLNPTPLNAVEFADRSFRFGAEYEYFVRAVSVGDDGSPLESSNSNILRAAPRDVFPPAPPAGLTIAAAPGRLSLFFAVNSETDVAGYEVFRSTAENKPLAEWQRVNPTPLNAPAYQDLNVESGVKYFYYVVALDTAGNRSEPSEIVSETVP